MKSSNTNIGYVTVITSTTPANLGKTFTQKRGKLSKKTAGAMTEATYVVEPFDSVTALAALMASLRTNHALCHSVPTTDDQEGTIVTKKAAAANPKPRQLARTKDHFKFKAQPGIMILDYDPADPKNAFTREELWAKLTELSPTVETAQVLWWCSGSSHIHDADGELQGLRGQRLYPLVQDASDIERAGKNLSDRCWLAGLGYVKVGNAGQRLQRTLFDEAMHEPARLDFIGGAVCTPPLFQQRGQPVVMGGPNWLDTREAFPELTQTEAATVKRLIDAAMEAAKPAAEDARAAWLERKIDSEAPGLQASKKMTLSEARQQVRAKYEAALGGTLTGDFEIPLPDGQSVTVDEVLSNPDKWHATKTLDPIDPAHREGEDCGILYVKQDRPILYTLAHGSMTFNLTPSRKPTRFSLMTGEEMMAQPPSRWMVQGILPERGLGAIYGPPSCGKSFLVLDLALAVARGADWFGKHTTATPVVYFPLEGNVGERLKAWKIGAGQDATPKNFKVVPEGAYDFNNADDVEGLAETLTDFAPTGTLIIIDTLARATPGTDENSSRDMGLVIKAADHLARTTKGFVLLVHHSGKDDSKGMRGSSAILGAVDTLYKVTGSKDSPRSFLVEKNKEGRDGERFHFKLDEQVIGFDPIYQADRASLSVTQCSEAAAQEKGMGPNMAKLLEAITEALKTAPTNASYAPPGTPALTAAEARKAGDQAGIDRKRFPEAIEALLKRGTLKTGGPIPAANGRPVKLEKSVWLA
jgi:hypothetical protein